MSDQRSKAEVRCPTCNRWHLPVIAAGPTAGVGMVCVDCERAADSRKVFNAIMEHEVVGVPFQSAEGIWLIIDDNHIRGATGPEVKMAAELERATDHANQCERVMHQTEERMADIFYAAQAVLDASLRIWDGSEVKRDDERLLAAIKTLREVLDG